MHYNSKNAFSKIVRIANFFVTSDIIWFFQYAFWSHFGNNLSTCKKSVPESQDEFFNKLSVYKCPVFESYPQTNFLNSS